MAIKMRNNTDKDATCCECEQTQKEVLNMFDLCVGGNIHTICDECVEQIFDKCLKAKCMINGRIKMPRDIAISNKKKNKRGPNAWRD